MILDTLIIPLESCDNPEHLGGKGQQINWLLQAGFQIPKTWVIPVRAHEYFSTDPERFFTQLEIEIKSQFRLDTAYAVRSSANVEDSATRSFAGQFHSLLDVRGLTELRQAVERIFFGGQSSSLESYLKKSEIRAEVIRIGVLIQEMAQPVISGVAFSKNPITGMNEVIVEAIHGRGDALLQGGANPDRWVSKWGAWTAQPGQSTIDENIIKNVVSTTQEIEKLFGNPVDLEWVFDGEKLYWLQVRPITSLNNVKLYSNRISREFLPGIIKPLVWSINTPLVNGAWINLFSELIGPTHITPEDLAKSFYYRAYFNMGAIGQIFEILGFPRESLELLLGLEGGEDRPTFKPTPKTYRHLPRMLGFLLRHLRFGAEFEQAVPRLQADFDAIAAEPCSDLDTTALLELTERLFPIAQRAARYNIIAPLLQSILTRLFKGQLEKLGVAFEAFDLNRDHEELEVYDPHFHLSKLVNQFAALPMETQAYIRETPYDELPGNPGAQEFHSSIEEFLSQFGHLSDSGNDFSVPRWRERPATVVAMVLEDIQYKREVTRLGWEDLNFSALRRGPAKVLYRQTRKFHRYRESISSLYTYGYGLFRDIFLEIGRRMVQGSILAAGDDIFYLEIQEIKEYIYKNDSGTRLQALVDRRKAEIELSREAVLPDLIYGDDPPPLEDEPDLNRLTGVPTSRGYYQGAVKVVESTQEFTKLRPGDVLVIPYSDIAWTPLFSKAGAVIAEAGGILSHSSIVAREFNIPCVVSVTNACRLPENTTVTVNGFTGEITVHT